MDTFDRYIAILTRLEDQEKSCLVADDCLDIAPREMIVYAFRELIEAGYAHGEVKAYKDRAPKDQPAYLLWLTFDGARILKATKSPDLAEKLKATLGHSIEFVSASAVSQAITRIAEKSLNL